MGFSFGAFSRPSPDHPSFTGIGIANSALAPCGLGLNHWRASWGAMATESRGDALSSRVLFAKQRHFARHNRGVDFPHHQAQPQCQFIEALPIRSDLQWSEVACPYTPGLRARPAHQPKAHAPVSLGDNAQSSIFNTRKHSRGDLWPPPPKTTRTTTTTGQQICDGPRVQMRPLR